MESVYHIVTIRVNETSWAHVWRLRSRYLRTGYDSKTVITAVLTVMSGMDPHMISGNIGFWFGFGLVGLSKWMFIRLWVDHGEIP
jgi:hypothetical protein